MEAYCRHPNPEAELLLPAVPTGVIARARRMDLTDKERYQRIRETMGEYCGIVELARVEEGEAVRWIGEYCATRDVKIDRKSTRLNSSHGYISYAGFCLKKKKTNIYARTRLQVT